jgi:hypothetical protein
MKLGVLSWPGRHRWAAITAVTFLVVAAFLTVSQDPSASASTGVAQTQFVDQQTEFCLDSNYSNPAYPAVGAVYTDPCNGGRYQQWIITYNGAGPVTLTDAQTGFCLDSNYSNPAYPAVGAVYTDPCNAGRYQQWWVGVTSNDRWVLQDAQTGLVLDSNYSNPDYPATGAVYTDGCNHGTFQQWNSSSNGTLVIPALPGGAPAICTAP